MGRHRDLPSVESEDQDDAENVAPARQEKQAGEKKILKRKLHTLETNYNQVAQSEADLRATNRELEAEVTLLKDSQNSCNDEDPHANRKTKKSKRSQFSASQAKTIRDAGKKFAAMQHLWFPLAAWDFLLDNEQSDEDEDDTGWDLEEREKMQAAAKELFDFLPSHLRSKANKAAFRTEFQEGMRELRAPFVNKLAQDPGRVFDIHDMLFHKKAERSKIPEVQQLLNAKQFLYSQDPPKGYLRHPCLLQALRLLLFGPSSLTDGGKSSKTRGTYDVIWGLTSVNHGILCFVSTALYFVLSGATEFSEESDGYQFDKFYTKRKEILDTWYRSEDPAKKQEYNDLLFYLNSTLWPNHHQDGSDASRFDSEERQLLAHIAGDDERRENGLNDGEGGGIA